MKSKKTTYYLIAGFILIWGVVGYRFIHTFLEENTGEMTYVNTNTLKQANSDIDTFSIKVNYRDPFLEKTYATSNTSYTPPSAPVSSGTGKKNGSTDNLLTPPAILKQIQFQGIISNTSQQKDIALVVIQGEEHLLGVGDRLEDITIQKISPISIEVLVHEKLYTINRE